jgi:hypothetical protein
MDAFYGFSKDRHDQGIGSINPRELHIVGDEIGGDSLKNQLTHIGKFSFISLEGDGKESDPNECGEKNY